MNLVYRWQQSSGEPVKIKRHHYRATRHMVAIYYMYYNYCRIHQTLRVTPAMEAKIADHAWSVGELVSLLDKRSILHGLLGAA